MSKSRGSKLPWDARAVEVLAGRLKLDAVELIALVNEVNPTGRGRDERESAARYAQKARLISLLIARFPDALEVSPEPEHEGVVSIRHRTHRHAACHAALDALDDDARSWAQRRLDLGTDSDAAPSRPRRTAPEPEAETEDDDPDVHDPDAALAAAVRAEEEFDFERAGRLYRRAFDQRRDARTAHALLRFLVDAMAADADALAIEAELPAAVRAHPSIRVLLGLAAARTGDHDRAAARVSQSGEPRAAEVLALVARSDLARGDTGAAAARLAAAEAADPAYPDLRPLAAEIAKAREAERAPLEAELARLVSAGHDAEASAKAGAILARWPESEAARRAQKTLEGRRRTDEGRRLFAEASAARARGELATASALFHRALAAPVDDATRAGAQRALAEIAVEERAMEARAHAERALAALAAPDRAEGFAAYAELDEEARRLVRARAASDALGWIDAMTAAGARPRIAVEAAAALERALAIEGTDPAGALGLLAPHERALGAVPIARGLDERARAALAEEHHRRARDALAAAEEALAAGDAERSRKHLERAGRNLDGELRARAESVRARLAELVERHRLEKRFEKTLASHDYVGARRAAEVLAASGADRARWAEVVGTFDADVRRARRVRVFDVDEGAACSRGLYLTIYPPAVHASIDLRRGVAVVPTAAGADVFVRCFSLDTGRLVRAVHLVAPDRLDEPMIQISGDSALVMGGSNGVLEVSLDTGQPLRWSCFRDASKMERRFENGVQPVPGGRYLWIVFDDDGSEGSVHDLEGERPPRAIPLTDRFHLMPGMIPPRVAAIRGDIAVSLHEPAGNQIARYDIAHEAEPDVSSAHNESVEAIAPRPSGDGVCLVFRRREKHPKPHTVHWAELSPQGEMLRTGPIEGAAAYTAAKMACARDLGMLFIGFRTNERDGELLALIRDPASAPGAGCLRVAYRASLGPGRVLAQDPEGRRVFVVGEHDGGVEIAPLGPEPPALPERPSLATKFPLTRLWDCTQPAGMRWPEDLFVAHFKWKAPDQIRPIARALRDERAGDLPGLLRIFWSLAVSEDAEGAGELAAWLAERYPGDPDVRQAQWAALAVQRKWDALIALLDPADPASLSEAAVKHRHHLLAAARIVTGDMAAAVRHVEEGKALPGPCDLAPLDALCDALAHEPAAGDVPPGLSPLRQLLAVVRAADARLAEGDHEGVIAACERAVVWEHREIQSFARLATAHLARPATTDAERLRKSLALAMFADMLYENRVGFRTELILPRATWPDERLAPLVAQANAWLAEAIA